MERTEHKIHETVYHKEFSKASFTGFSRNYPSSLRTVLSPQEYDNIILAINASSVKTKKTTTLKTMYTVGAVLTPVFIGIPIFLGCEIANQVIYNGFYKKLSLRIQAILIQINNSEICRSKSIIFSFRKSERTEQGRVFSLLISFLRYPTTNPTTSTNTTTNLNYSNYSSSSSHQTINQPITSRPPLPPIPSQKNLLIKNETNKNIPLDSIPIDK